MRPRAPCPSAGLKLCSAAGPKTADGSIRTIGFIDRTSEVFYMYPCWLGVPRDSVNGA